MKIMDKEIYIGFLPINENFLRNEVVDNGENLVSSKHVINAVEKQRAGAPVQIIGCVIPQSSSQNDRYEVTLTLDVNRNVTTAVCTCPQGLGMCCKHIGALIYYVNNEDNSGTQTDKTQSWGKPSLKKYNPLLCKGKRISAMFPLPESYVEGKQQIKRACITAASVRGLNCPVGDLLRSEEIPETERLATRLENERQQEEARQEIKRLVQHLLTAPLPLKVTFRNPQSVLEKDCEELYNKQVVLDLNSIVETAYSTIEQSLCDSWFENRKWRISASRAHDVKTRRDNFSQLAIRLSRVKNGQYAATIYGKNTEKVAREVYAKEKKCQVKQVGVIIKPDQPWICCSPDGIVLDSANNSLRLLEIKCPYSCRDSFLIDPKTRTSNLPYLQYNDKGVLQFIESKSIYTQVQIQMYVTSLPSTDLFIYSPQQTLLLTIPKNNLFLSKVIPKIEEFYFKHYLTYLKSTLRKNC